MSCWTNMVRLPRLSSAAVWVSIALSGVLGFRCAHGPSPPVPSDLPHPRSTAICPAPVVTHSASGQPMAVTFENPRPAGGGQPESATCAPASGTAFSLGTTTVECSVIDLRQQTSTCKFTVRVTGPPRLSATTFLAFGDSITGGSTPPDPVDAYPPRLLVKLRSQYPHQTFVVINDGRAGENVSTTGRTRMQTALDVYKPGALLLMEGSNDLLGGSAGASAALAALTEMVRAAKARGVVVVLATLPPQRLNGPRNGVARSIPAFNESIKALAQQEGATLVDVFEALGGDGRYIGPDDLHPPPIGFEVIAHAFFVAIQQKLEMRD